MVSAISEEISQINLSGKKIGLLGLPPGVFEEVVKLKSGSEASIKAEILRRVKQQNYIPANARVNYAEALADETRLRVVNLL